MQKALFEIGVFAVLVTVFSVLSAWKIIDNKSYDSKMRVFRKEQVDH
jgi:uncharacterized membrane protein